MFSRLAQRLGQPGLGQPEHPNGVLAVDRAAGDRLLAGGCLDCRCATWAEARGAVPAARSPSACRAPPRRARCRPDRAPRAPAGTMACLRLAARTASKLPDPMCAISFLRMSAILFSELVVQSQLEAAETRHDRDGHVVGGRSQAAAGDDQVHALVGHEAQLGFDVGGAVTADGDVRQFDAQFQQPVGDPRAVSVWTRPVKTSVPVTTMPARALTATTLGVADGLTRQVTLDGIDLAGHRVGDTRSPVRLDHRADPRCRAATASTARCTTAITSAQVSPSITVNIESVLLGRPESRTTRTASATIHRRPRPRRAG